MSQASFESPRVEQKLRTTQLDVPRVTPDDWIERDAALVRLTGEHPFNAQPPTLSLVDAGPVTPTSLHYVRNHGSVPRLAWESHRVVVDGLVNRECTLTMSELESQFELRRLAVTIACDGNRRKELNAMRRTSGFDWSAGGVSTAVWRGVLVRDVVAQRCGGAQREARFVTLEGADADLPYGSYAACFPIGMLCSEHCDALLAFEMNGARLTPDHGFPVRLLVPGHVGGRMVKWLRRITFSRDESTNHYHVHDNRIVIESSLAKPVSTIIRELNVNSVIAWPAHGATLSVHCDAVNEQQCVRGYAYSGGGRRVVSVDLSLDGGARWLPCVLDQSANARSDAVDGDRAYAWCLWRLDLSRNQLLFASELVVRAFDAAWNTQPNDRHWNKLGMMNNSLYRVRLQRTAAQDAVIFHHPVEVGFTSGGWLTTEFDSPMARGGNGDLASQPVLAARSVPASLPQFTASDVAKHCTRDDCWLIMDGLVYDVTSYLREHPGGATPLLVYAGAEASLAFRAIHNHEAYEHRESYCVGVLVDKAPPADDDAALDAFAWREWRVVERRAAAQDLVLLRLAAPRVTASIGLPVGAHVLVAV